MNLITQKDDFGCGVACVASVAKISYRAARNVLGEAKANKTGFYCVELKLALEYLGYSYTYEKFRSDLGAKLDAPGTIILLHKSVTYPFGHYLTKTSHGWMDPWLNLAEDNRVGNAKSGYRRELPGKPYYILYSD